jgi:hypothetical protein
MTTQNYSIPRDNKGVVEFFEKNFMDGLSQAELNEAYNDVSKDYDKVCCIIHIL